MEQLKKIAEHYGLDNQLIKLAEEASELSAAALQYRANPKKLESLLEEIADVENVICQIKYLIRQKELVTVNVYIDCCREEKIERQMERIEKEKNNA